MLSRLFSRWSSARRLEGCKVVVVVLTFSFVFAFCCFSTTYWRDTTLGVWDLISACDSLSPQFHNPLVTVGYLHAILYPYKWRLFTLKLQAQKAHSLFQGTGLHHLAGVHGQNRCLLPLTQAKNPGFSAPGLNCVNTGKHKALTWYAQPQAHIQTHRWKWYLHNCLKVAVGTEVTLRTCHTHNNSSRRAWMWISWSDYTQMPVNSACACVHVCYKPESNSEQEQNKPSTPANSFPSWEEQIITLN